MLFLQFYGGAPIAPCPATPIAYRAALSSSRSSPRAHVGGHVVRPVQCTKGGPLKGFEIIYQQPFTFLPGIGKNFGVLLNYTYVNSKIEYLVLLAGMKKRVILVVRRGFDFGGESAECRAS